MSWKTRKDGRRFVDNGIGMSGDDLKKMKEQDENRLMDKLGIPHHIGRMTIDEFDAYMEARYARFRKAHPHADRNKALTGSPYYKLDGQKIFCIDCGQRLGNMIDPCPICDRQTVYVYESMLHNPADPRWMRPQYRKRFMESQEQIALNGLKDRQRSINDADDLV